ncbi:MAG: hypothetical protein COV43_07780 [Deltaproteobacteria bacterium CG11_big_fil_rev_8_21_14_0_20_42_23]|nr:MAG: hypothetical protein COV43_07780 [Deltaproteobacteria bacterium CG11_big_fil_rev_8_21_14_0_20_42_23]PJC63451.1 MAG: hypothetical protein CO021_09400 [Deltaproteobacteria bacterium CG_4_9_14_0_2_um_filter_42_21]
MKRFFFLLLFSFAAVAHAQALPDPTYDGSYLVLQNFDELAKNYYDRVLSLLRPVQGRVSSNYGIRLHPLKGKKFMHKGVDIACPLGTPVRAVQDGRVKSEGWNGGYGKQILLAHEGIISGSRYAHLSRIVVNPGEFVREGETIAYSGDTGLVTGPHLHFELFRQEKLIDPEQYFDRSTSLQLMP